jgi:hypothetical protein
VTLAHFCTAAPQTWGLEGEWKLTRLAPLLASARFVVSEAALASGMLGPDEAYFGPGVVFATPSRLASALLAWLQAGSVQRAAVAAAGRELLQLRDTVSVVGTAVRTLYTHRGCL